MQQRIVALQQKDGRETGDMESHIKVFAELTITDILKENGKVSAAYGYWRESGS
jgi:succinate dehydrogenase / fumarate reductase flavoprotein subunit